MPQARSRSHFRQKRSNRFQNGGLVLFLLVAAMFVTSAGGSAVHTRSPPLPCVQCNTREIPDAVFARRYLGTCMACGEMYGTGIAHCCMCHEEFTKQCNLALRKR
ncbi:hypothetical protein RRG08_019378 [Elysia crispata]|uniref:Uncharacterized protein n=1 Tax=Elysia crispata TaxID=231223 RepID=A0AAE0XST3_9GAST|nr:hypothetical protein RRG08_019378 [Elysia crispata]